MMINRPEESKSSIEKVFDFYEKNAKKLNRLFKITALIIFLLLVTHFSLWGYNRYVYNNMLKRTANQISQLIDNVRTTYAVHTQTQTDIMKLMARSNTMPDFLVRDGRLYNVYGGTIAVSSSLPIRDGKTGKLLPTFKIAYQGLRHDVCVDLAQLEWGNERTGLIAVALGQINGNGVDTALRDLEEDTSGGIVEIEEDGVKKAVEKPAYALSTVGKPNDPFNPTPFSSIRAESGCSCGARRACSFALRYYTYTTPSR